MPKIPGIRRYLRPGGFRDSVGRHVDDELAFHFDMCVDELVLRLAEPQNIASVTWLSRDPKNSNVAELGARIPVNHGLAEEIIPLNPDLIIAGIYTARTAVAISW